MHTTPDFWSRIRTIPAPLDRPTAPLLTFLEQAAPHARGPLGGGRAQQHDAGREDGGPVLALRTLGGLAACAWYGKVGV